MSELPSATLMEDSCRESAASTLSMIESLGERARKLQQGIWLLPAALGATTILGTTLLSSEPKVSSCSERPLANRVVSCSIGHEGFGYELLWTIVRSEHDSSKEFPSRQNRRSPTTRPIITSILMSSVTIIGVMQLWADSDECRSPPSILAHALLHHDVLQSCTEVAIGFDGA